MEFFRSRRRKVKGNKQKEVGKLPVCQMPVESGESRKKHEGRVLPLSKPKKKKKLFRIVTRAKCQGAN